MTNERPEEDAVCWFTNAADRPVDVHVNHHAEAYTTIEPTEDQPVFSVESDAGGVYGTYTFEARETDDPDGEVLASAAVEFEAGDGYTAVFHRTVPGEYQLSVYDTDFSPSAASRFEIRHVGHPAEVDWTLAPIEEADPRIPVDERSGTLERGQWQRAINVTENKYRLEVTVDGEVVAFRPQLQQEAELMNVCYVVGDPKPGMRPDAKKSHVFRNRFHVPAGPEREDETTAPAEPYATTDDNQSVEFDYETPELYETNPYEIQLEVTDPDGIVDGLALDAVEPGSDGFRIPDGSIRRPTGIGEPMTATLQVSSEVSPDGYDVRVVANPEGLGERVTHTIPLAVEPITVERLWDRVEHHHGNDAVTDDVATELFALLRDAGASPGGLDGFVDDVLSLFDSGDESPDPRSALADVIALVTERRGDGIDQTASVDIETETRALRERLGSE